jgi:signal peptidase II
MNSKGLIVAALIAAIDWNIKHIVKFYHLGTTNTGAAFGILQGYNGALAIFAGIVSIALIVVLAFFRLSKLQEIGVGLLLGGTAGNLIDRLFFGHVIDYLDLGWWPSFNLADAANVIGVALLIIAELRKEKKSKTVHA